MEYQLELKNNKGEIVGYAKVDEDDYNKYKIGFWHLSKGYASGKFGKLKGILHRFIMNAEKGSLRIDHINNEKLDNRKSNLRFATAHQNSQNKSKTANATSRYFGVSKFKDKWVCSLHNKEGKHIIHKFVIEEHAAYCYDILAKIHYGADARINKIGKPVDYKEPVIKTKPVHKGVYENKSGSFSVSVWYDKKLYGLGTYDTLEKAILAYNKKYKEFEDAKTPEAAPEIKRNDQGQAIIEMFNKKKEKVSECIVDDDKYYSLMEFTWHVSLGYVKTHMNNTTVMIHRHLMNPPVNMKVDHINNNPLDNRVSNLRICTDTLNSHNRKIKEGEYRGTSKIPSGNYTSIIIKDGIQYHLGTYTTEKDAAKAYDRKARELYGKDASTNFEEDNDDVLVTSTDVYKTTTSSKYRGVSLTERGTYQAQLKNGENTYRLGTFNTEEEAARVYDKKSRELFGDKAFVNFKDINDSVILTRNQKKKATTTSSKYRGVSLEKDGKYRVQLTKDGKTHRLGRFSNEEEAARAYDTKSKELSGDKANLNFP